MAGQHPKCYFCRCCLKNSVLLESFQVFRVDHAAGGQLTARKCHMTPQEKTLDGHKHSEIEWRVTNTFIKSIL